jgi:hypothetical protein
MMVADVESAMHEFVLAALAVAMVPGLAAAEAGSQPQRNGAGGNAAVKAGRAHARDQHQVAVLQRQEARLATIEATKASKVVRETRRDERQQRRRARQDRLISSPTA